eukprot:TRINITY_DN1470_c0_g1_i1.p1 TRINITY_DN1470_c0_g1~~TRINITY_DN1470_c0_g1_i1.p1  ORF type:complete len:192 (+),score=41.63 TRINITY_DN1470_c0_g1_i1:49-624(+)
MADNKNKPAPAPEVNLQDTFKKEANDPSMQAYLRSLGIDPNYVPPKDDPRRVVISELAIVFKDHNPTVLKFETEDDVKNAKKHPLVIKEGCSYKMRVSFRVQHNVVLGLQIKNAIYSKVGAKLASDVEMLGTYPPKNEFQAVSIPKNDWNEAPSGMLARGEYKGKMKFVDDDEKTHMEFEYVMKIAKDFSD